MFDIGATEMLVVAAVALVVVAPKDLPGMLKTIGFYIGKAKRMANDVQRQVNDVMHQAEIEAIKDDISKANGEMKSAVSFDLEEPSKSSEAAKPAAKDETPS